MAQPLRWVLISLSIRLGLSIREVEQFDVSDIRSYLAVLREDDSKENDAGAGPAAQSADELKANFEAALGKNRRTL